MKKFALLHSICLVLLLKILFFPLQPKFEITEKKKTILIWKQGALHRFGEGSAKDAFYEQIHNNLSALILHMNEESQSVNNVSFFSLFFFFFFCYKLTFNVLNSCFFFLWNFVLQACKQSLKKLAHLYRSKGLKELFDTLEADRSLDYIEFLNEFSKILVKKKEQNIYFVVLILFTKIKIFFFLLDLNTDLRFPR